MRALAAGSERIGGGAVQAFRDVRPSCGYACPTPLNGADGSHLLLVSADACGSPLCDLKLYERSASNVSMNATNYAFGGIMPLHYSKLASSNKNWRCMYVPAKLCGG